MTIDFVIPARGKSPQRIQLRSRCEPIVFHYALNTLNCRREQLEMVVRVDVNRARDKDKTNAKEFVRGLLTRKPQQRRKMRNLLGKPIRRHERKGGGFDGSRHFLLGPALPPSASKPSTIHSFSVLHHHSPFKPQRSSRKRYVRL